MEIYSRPTEYVVCALPPGHPEESHFQLTVSWRGPGDRWAVLRYGQCLSKSGRWDYEPLPSARTTAWRASHRFDLETALTLAKRAAPKVTINGFSVTDALKMHAEPMP